MKPAATEDYGFSKTIHKAKADLPSSLPFHLHFSSWLLAVLCSSSFYIGPILLTVPLLLNWWYPKAAATLFCVNVILVFHPIKPSQRFRQWFQLFYHLFNFHHNINPLQLRKRTEKENHLAICAMHPHAIIPLQAFLWGAFCDQCMPGLYGVGATTNAALKLPILRHVLQLLSVGSASKEVILTAMQEKGKNLFILPGGVAEIFLSHRRTIANAPFVQTIKARRYGLMKLALQTGACIYPVYVFGATDMFDQLTPVKKGHSAKGYHNDSHSLFDSIAGKLESVSRRIQGGLTLYWGKYYLPVPHTPRLTMVMADPIYPVPGTSEMNVKGKMKTCKRIDNPSVEQIEELMARYVDSLHCLFEQYKVQAGYPNDTLQII